MDAIDQQIVALLVEDARRSYGDIGRRIALSAPAVKRRVDRLRERGVIEGFTAVLDPGALDYRTEALVELFFAPGTLLEEVAEQLLRHPAIVEAWSVAGDADAVARVQTRDARELEQLIMELQRHGNVVRTRSQIVMSRLVRRGASPAGTPP
jgi:DNA-binding Lrp family transcriptional regulator